MNAFPYMAVLAGLSALAAGNQVWLKAPSGCGASLEILQGVFNQEFGDQLSLAATPGREFVEWALEDDRVQMLHFIGGSEAGASYLGQAFERGKALLVDGDGNCQVYVGPSIDPTEVGNLLASSATRFNGETCTSAVGATVHPAVFDAVFESLKEAFAALRCGNPADSTVDIGPLFSQTALDHSLARISGSGGEVAFGGTADGLVMTPTLVESPTPGSDLVRSGVFAPALWLRKGTLVDFETVWNTNRYPLCAGVLSHDESDIEHMSALRRLSRLTVNGDTSLEDPLEPWGAWPSSGNGKVENWIARYQRNLQLDLPSSSVTSS